MQGGEECHEIWQGQGGYLARPRTSVYVRSLPEALKARAGAEPLTTGPHCTVDDCVALSVTHAARIVERSELAKERCTCSGTKGSSQHGCLHTGKNTEQKPSGMFQASVVRPLSMRGRRSVRPASENHMAMGMAACESERRNGIFPHHRQ